MTQALFISFRYRCEGCPANAFAAARHEKKTPVLPMSDATVRSSER